MLIYPNARGAESGYTRTVLPPRDRGWPVPATVDQHRRLHGDELRARAWLWRRLLSGPATLREVR
ncbi:hypothetical protein TPA0598_17_00170 [Streptomyces lydicamycinicus]|uniref:Uncharacterized protein n=1 Tax=Streptomyces lydicamycinicus TaxID=1546107 RepID=A0A0P4RI11_9ACTN|nr:hypothetical protein [Streptomyces lydicamycinicus]GAO13036.1 hypothetical protein TPA0598_17_00170 [Streptomyces lydicamycinicus]